MASPKNNKARSNKGNTSVTSSLTIDKALTLSWPNHGAAVAALKKAKFDFEALGLILTPSEDDRKGYVLMHSTPPTSETTGEAETGATTQTDVTEGAEAPSGAPETGDGEDQGATEDEAEAGKTDDKPATAKIRSLRAPKPVKKAAKSGEPVARGTGMTFQFRRMVLANALSPKPLDRAALMAEGRSKIPGINKTTLNVVYADALSALAMIREMGMLKTPNSEEDQQEAA